MNIKNTNSDLLNSLRALLNKVSLILYRMRSHSYRLFTKYEKSNDVTEVLHRNINDLILKSGSKPELNGNDVKVKGVEKIKQFSHSPNNIGTDSQLEHMDDNRNSKLESDSELGKHLSGRPPSSVVHSSLGDKLAKSAWEHVHTAVRYAKQGELGKAKLNTNIAGHALEEAAHYLSDKEYATLVNKIEKYFKESQ